jgi:alkaline phosphatase D
MRQRWLCLAVGVLGLVLVARPTFSVPLQLKHGVASGDVTDTTAVIWARADGEGVLVAEYATSPAFDVVQNGGSVHVSPMTDFTGTVVLTALHPATRYYYRVRLADAEIAAHVSGSFTTAPPPELPSSVSFLWGGDLGGQGFCRQPEYRIFTPMKAVAADFFIFGGDTIYADSLCPAPPNAPGADFKATTQAEFWAKHRYQREDQPFRELLAVTSVYALWDDHEVKNDFSGLMEPLMPLGRQAFFDYFPIQRATEEPQRLYRSFRWGKHLEMFILDARQYRSPNSHADSEDKTMLGSPQLHWLLNGLTASTATWKIIVSSVPLSAHTGSFVNGRDGWGGGFFADGFGTELKKIITTLHDRGLRNVAWLSTDIHVARILSYDPNQDDVPDFHEFISGPLSAITGNFDTLDQTFRPQVLYEETNFFNFGMGKIDGQNGALTIEIHDQEGKRHYMLTLPAR